MRYGMLPQEDKGPVDGLGEVDRNLRLVDHCIHHCNSTW